MIRVSAASNTHRVGGAPQNDEVVVDYSMVYYSISYYMIEFLCTAWRYGVV